MLIASAILAFSSLMFVRFAIAYCHSIVATTECAPLSPVTARMAQLTYQNTSAADFRRITRLIALCPHPSEDQRSLSIVRMYFFVLNIFSAFLPSAPAYRRWIRAERARCSRFALAALDRRVRADVTPVT